MDACGARWGGGEERDDEGMEWALMTVDLCSGEGKARGLGMMVWRLYVHTYVRWEWMGVMLGMWECCERVEGIPLIRGGCWFGDV